ncbi:MAG: TatD family hydrolase, partial [Patescibacteria group bacterium]
MLIDSHAHLNFNAFKNDREATAQRALESGVWLINVGSQIDTSRRAMEFAQKFKEGVFAAVGLHPIHLKEQKVKEGEEEEFETRVEVFDPAKYEALAYDRKVVAIGEIGLDYFHSPENKELQREVLLEQLILAEKLKKP